MNKNKNRKKEAGEESNQNKEKTSFSSRRDFLTGSTGFAAGLALGSGGASLLFPPKEVVEKEKIKTETKTVSQYICPYADGTKFDTYEELKAHVKEQHTGEENISLPGIKETEEPTYQDLIINELNRYNQKNQAFARAVWDQDYKEVLLEASDKQEMPTQGGWNSFLTPDPTLENLEGFARQQGAIYTDNKAGNFNYMDKYGGYQGHLREGGGLYSWKEPVSENKYPVENKELMSNRIKRFAQFLGADLVGITKLDSKWIYSKYYDRVTQEESELNTDGPVAPESDTNISYNYVIVLGIGMRWEGIKTSPNWGSSAATALGYSKMMEISSKLARYIRMIGYPAVPSGNDTTQSIPLAIDAGLGQLGRNGLLITPKLGARQRIAKVYTNLPLKEDEPIDFGMRLYCENCKVCARACPVDAIPYGERSTDRPGDISNREGMKRWGVNTPKCLSFWVENNTDCSNCVSSCPWSTPGFDREKYGFEKNQEMWG